MEDKIKPTKAVKFCLSFNNLNAIKNKNKKSMGQQDSTDKESPKIKRSVSFVIKRFVPKISPKKSTIIPSLLKLNNYDNEVNEVISVKDCSMSENDSSSFESSTSIKFEIIKDNQNKNDDKKESDGCDESSDIEGEIKNDIKKKLKFEDSSKMMQDIIEEKESENENENEEGISCLRKKSGKIKFKSCIKNTKENDSRIHNELKNKFDIKDSYNRQKNNKCLFNDIKLNCKFGLVSTEQKIKRKPLLIRDVLLGNYKKKI